ncbi:DUF2628 domain-containing protein [Leptospira weilii]|uniref:DUF2628 domain-containing protein n=1 Tax=Leptospira weilii TaxID=28184 RepID=UPI000772EA89|nr:DUF2628 domain-containing protein [Leptospira weilii]
MNSKANEKLNRLLDSYDKDLSREFLGRNSGYYLKKWDTITIRKKTSGYRLYYSLNWAAILLGPVWYAYRKMYLYSILYSVILFVTEFCLNYFFKKDLLSNSMVGVGIVFGLMGNSIYLDFMVKKIDKIRSHSEINETTLTEKLRKQGGTNIVAAIIATLPILLGILMEFVSA